MKDEDLRVFTQDFIKSEYGKYILNILGEMYDGYLAGAENASSEHPIRHLDRSIAIKEVIKLIKSPLD